MKWNSVVLSNYSWSGEIINRLGKEEVAKQMALRVKNGDIVGVGSGSTAYLALHFISERVKKENLSILAIPTSAEMSLTCAALDIPTTSLLQSKPDWSFDGADEVDPSSNLIKGRGGAMFREKLLMSCCEENYILVDRTKIVERLCQNFPIPIEVFPESIHFVANQIKDLGAERINLRLAKNKDGPVITENGNYIIDARFSNVNENLENEIKHLPGVIESGLFLNYKVKIIVARNQ
ncbi:MAG: ribose 5-phosphate isomerase A [Bacteroidota bacterium]|jgi:ribose 5-phosphate isomerase A